MFLPVVLASVFWAYLPLANAFSVHNILGTKNVHAALAPITAPSNSSSTRNQRLANGTEGNFNASVNEIAIQHLREQFKDLKGFKSGIGQTLVHLDDQPLVVNMSFVASLNPKDGNPWVRYKRVKDAGKAIHPHFNGLVATGNFDHDILVGHNVVRERVGISSLQHDDGLVNLAVHRIEELVSGGCYIQHSDTSYRWGAAGFQYVGENVYKVINMEPTGVDLPDAWYAELYDYTYGVVGEPCVREKCADRSSPPCSIGHFTQMMWQESTHLGCAIAECPNQPQKTSVGVCYYGEGGNIVGRIPFESAPASELDYSGLCA